jgi:hypothetical protein
MVGRLGYGELKNGLEGSCCLIEALSRHLPGRTEENHNVTMYCNIFFYGSTALYGPGPPRFVEVS